MSLGSYEPHEWKSGEIITATRMNNIEQELGILDKIDLSQMLSLKVENDRIYLMYGSEGNKQKISEVKIPVIIPCESIEVSGAPDGVSVGDTFQVTYTLTPSNCNQKVTFSSSNPSVVTVNEDGLATIIDHGQAMITVTCGNCAGMLMLYS